MAHNWGGWTNDQCRNLPASRGTPWAAASVQQAVGASPAVFPAPAGRERGALRGRSTARLRPGWPASCLRRGWPRPAVGCTHCCGGVLGTPCATDPGHRLRGFNPPAGCWGMGTRTTPYIEGQKVWPGSWLEWPIAKNSQFCKESTPPALFRPIFARFFWPVFAPFFLHPQEPKIYFCRDA